MTKRKTSQKHAKSKGLETVDRVATDLASLHPIDASHVINMELCRRAPPDTPPGLLSAALTAVNALLGTEAKPGQKAEVVERLAALGRGVQLSQPTENTHAPIIREIAEMLDTAGRMDRSPEKRAQIVCAFLEQRQVPNSTVNAEALCSGAGRWTPAPEQERPSRKRPPGSRLHGSRAPPPRHFLPVITLRRAMTLTDRQASAPYALQCGPASSDRSHHRRGTPTRSQANPRG